MRGTIGIGTNRTNIHTFAKVSQGLADYFVNKCDKSSLFIGYDSRIKSVVFARVVAGVFTINGVVVHLWAGSNPVQRYLLNKISERFGWRYGDCKSFQASTTVIKIDGADGCQIMTEAASEILTQIKRLNIFADVKNIEFDKATECGNVKYISPDVLTAFIEKVGSEKN